VKKIKDIQDLFQRIGGPGLLPVPESGVGDPEFFARVNRYDLVIKIDTGNLIIGKMSRCKFGSGISFNS